MKERFFQQASREYSPGQRLAALAVEALFFIGVLPRLLSYTSSRLDRRLGLPALAFKPFSTAVGGVLTIVGWLLAMWAIGAQFSRGRGTPVPLMATQRLVVEPPFRYCRNPMALGAILMYLGLAIVRGSLAAVGIVLAVAAALLSYIKGVEERELVARFGQEYLAYRERTPFLIPRPFG